MLKKRVYKTAGGFTLIEVLVTIVIISVGLLGFSALMVKSVVYNRQAYYRTAATILANDITERMRANKVGAMAGLYNITNLSSISDPDINQWASLLTDSLPKGSASVVTSVNGTDLNVTITIGWVDGASYSFVSQTVL